jgi:phosphoadenosine phosphosulfate reductase
MADLDLRTEEAAELIRSVLRQQKGAACVTSSFQADCMVLVDLVVQQKPDIPVLFLDTGYHFPETYAYRDEMAGRFKLRLINLTARISVNDQESRFGILYESAPDRCCGMRKVEPLFEGLQPFDVWFTALRREQSPTRANLEPIDRFKLPGGKELLKVSPLAMWSNAEVWGYLKRRSIPAMQLYDRGYTSIGCAPCTAPPLDPDNPRSGRWAGKQKLECGIHLSE